MTTFKKVDPQYVPSQPYLSNNVKLGTTYSSSYATPSQEQQRQSSPSKPARGAAVSAGASPSPPPAGSSSAKMKKSSARRDQSNYEMRKEEAQERRSYASSSLDDADDGECEEAENSPASFADYYNSNNHGNSYSASSSSAYTPNITAVHSITTWEEISSASVAQNYVANKGNPQKIVPIAKVQDAKGSWSLDALLSFFPEAKDLMDKNPILNSGCESKDSELLWSTALAVMVLQNKYKDDEPTWRLIVAKAKQWIRKSQISQRLMGVDFLGEAAKLIQS